MEAAAEEPGPTRGSLLGTSHNHNVGERAHEVEDRSQIVETYRAETKWMESEHMWDRSAESEDAAEESPSDSSQTETESESDDSDDQSDDSDDESDESDDERRYGLADWNVFEKKAVASPLTGSIKSWSQGLLVHANKRLIELIIDARKALHTSRWSALWRSIQELVKWLNRAQLSERLKSLGLLLPILSRLFQDLDHLVIREPTMNSKVYRQRLERDEAKALSVMQQKWPKLWTQEMNLNFLDIIQRYSVDKPRTIAGVDDLPTRTILDCLERILLRLSHRFALSDMRLIQIPAALLDLEAIVAWYLLFGPIFSSSSSSGPFSSLLSDPTKEVLLEIKFLDLSGNELTEIHPKLPSVLPGLQKLTLSGNPLGCLPASSCQWVWLTTVRLDPPRRRQTSRRRLGRILACTREPPTLVESCLSRLIASHGGQPALSAIHDHGRPLPVRLCRALARGRSCDGCRRFRWSAQKALYLPGSFFYLVRGFSRRLSIILGPSFLCPACLPLHYSSCPSHHPDSRIHLGGFH